MNLVHFLQSDFCKEILQTFDIFFNKNTKYLVYCYNDYQNSVGESLIKIRHSLVTDNYLIAEEIQNQDWNTLLNV